MRKIQHLQNAVATGSEFSVCKQSIPEKKRNWRKIETNLSEEIGSDMLSHSLEHGTHLQNGIIFRIDGKAYLLSHFSFVTCFRLCFHVHLFFPLCMFFPFVRNLVLFFCSIFFSPVSGLLIFFVILVFFFTSSTSVSGNCMWNKLMPFMCCICSCHECSTGVVSLWNNQLRQM